MELTCECAVVYCTCGGHCAEEATRAVWDEGRCQQIYYCSACFFSGDEEVIKGASQVGMKRKWFIAEGNSGEMVAIFANTTAEAEKLAGVHPWKVGDKVAITEATTQEILLFNLREDLL